MKLAHEHDPATEVRHLSSWGVMQSSKGGELTLKAGTHCGILLLASRLNTADGCTSAQIDREELTVQYAGLNP